MKSLFPSQRFWSAPVRLSGHGVVLMGLLLSLGLTFSACELPAMPWDKKPAPKDAKAAEAEKAAAEEEEAATEEPKGPPDETDLLPPAMRKLPYEEVNITLPDQLIVYGRLYDPSLTARGENDFPDAETYKGAKYPLVILIHGLNHSHTAWSDLPAVLTQAGYAVFAMDLRGHGKSATTTWKHRVNWRFMKPEQWVKLHQDIGQVIAFFKKGEDYPEVDGTKVGLIGEKLGANLATFAAKNNKEVKALVLISPGLVFKDIDASRGLLDYPNSTLILASQDVKSSFNEANHLYNWITGPKTLQVYEKIGEGAEMLVRQPDVENQIRDWLINPLPPVGGPAPASAVTTDADASQAAKKPEVPAETGHNSEAAKKDAEATAKPESHAQEKTPPAAAKH